MNFLCRIIKIQKKPNTVLEIRGTAKLTEMMDFIKLGNESNDSNKIREGKAEILEPPGKKVFYNPVQEFNRDLSILSLQILSKHLQQNEANKGCKTNLKNSFRILEAFSATGLRSIRYAKELSHVTEVIANDISEVAVKNIKKNIEHNQVESLVNVSHSNAISLMFSSIEYSKRFHAVDLDPYGSPVQFLDTAVQCVVDGGMLLVTCTDMAILCGNFPETCYVKYGAISLKMPAHHEMVDYILCRSIHVNCCTSSGLRETLNLAWVEKAIRIVLQNIQSHASRYKRYIVPMLSVSADFYVRVFVKIYTGAASCKLVTSNLSMVYSCTGCHALTLQPLGITKRLKNESNYKHSLPHSPPVGQKCEHCSGNHHMGGPIWSGPIHSKTFVQEMLKSQEINELGTSKRLIGILSVINEELDVPLYYNNAKLSSVLRTSTIPMMTLRSAILNGNYKVSFSHACKESIKTDAPMSYIWDIIKEWMKMNSTTPKNIEPLSPADVILRKPVQSEIDFSLRPDANPLSREMKLTRYQENPMPFWGPGTKSMMNCLTENPKKKKNQNKMLKRKYFPDVTPNKEMKLCDAVENSSSTTGKCEIIDKQINS